MYKFKFPKPYKHEHEKICDGNIHITLYRIKSKYVIPISEL